MATKKQRRRRAKGKRHEYEYVWVDDEGNEIESPDDAPEKRAARTSSRRPDPQAPSWQRTFKRAAIFAPIMLGTVMLLSKDLTLTQQLTQTLLLVGIFVPFSYFIDRYFYRSFRRRQARHEQSTGRRGT